MSDERYRVRYRCGGRLAPPAAARRIAYPFDDPELDRSGAAAAISRKAAGHAHAMKDDFMRMRRVDALDVPAGGRIVLQPGTDNVMPMGLAKPTMPAGRSRCPSPSSRPGP